MSCRSFRSDEQGSTRSTPSSLLGFSARAQPRRKISWSQDGGTWKQEFASMRSTPSLVNGASGESPMYSSNASMTPASTEYMPFNRSNEFRRSASISCMNPCSELDEPDIHAQKSFQWMEERIDAEVKDRRRLWGSLMEDLGKNQATVKRLEEKLEDMQLMFQGQNGCVHKLEGIPHEVGERCDALEDRMERLNRHYGMLEVQLGRLQMSIEQTKTSPVQFETQLEARFQRFAAQLEKEQLADGRRNQQLHSTISELQAQVIVKDTCSALEARWKAEIEQLKRSNDRLAEQFEELHVRYERRCSTLEACAGGVCMPELVATTPARPYKQMSVLQQALMEGRSNCATRQPSPLKIDRGRRNSCYWEGGQLS